MESDGPLLAIAAYRCEIGGKRSDSIDIQVRYFASGTTQEIEDFPFPTIRLKRILSASQSPRR
jgi:hypothetical protein